MKCHIPQISWHNRDPVLSVDFQISKNGIRRIATAGTDTHVLIWLLNVGSDGTNVNLECVAELTRHSKTVNVVRFSPNGEILASADDEAAIILWRHQPRVEGDIFADEESVANKENWTPMKVLRGHIDDICDLSWSADSHYLVTGSVDNSAIVWDIRKAKSLGHLSEHKGFVQGVSWDPLGQYIATLCSDRSLRIFNITTRKVVYRIQKAVLPNNNNKAVTEVPAPPKASRIFYDDTLKSFCRRLCFSPCGQLLIVPTGIIEESEGKFSNATFVFTRNNLNKPALYLPTSDKFTLAVRCCPLLFQIRPVVKKTKESEPGDENPSKECDSLFSLPYRVVFAVATQDSIFFYDSQQAMPFSKVSNIHYTRLCDLSWSSDGLILMASSTDGYCSFVLFSEGELGLPYVMENNQEENNKNFKQPEPASSPAEKTETMDWNLVLEPDSIDCLPGGKPSVSELQDSVAEMNVNDTPCAQSDTTNGNMTGMDTQLNENNSDKLSPVNQSKTNEPSISQPQKRVVSQEKATRRIQLITLSNTITK